MQEDESPIWLTDYVSKLPYPITPGRYRTKANGIIAYVCLVDDIGAVLGACLPKNRIGFTAEWDDEGVNADFESLDLVERIGEIEHQ